MKPPPIPPNLGSGPKEPLAIVGRAALAAFFVCFGSFFVIVAPGDGQTGMVAFPLYLIGAILGIWSICLAIKPTVPGVERWIVAALALIAVGSVVWGFVACQQYSRDWEQRHKNGRT